MPTGVIFAFVVVFALVMLAVSVGTKFFDARRKKQVVAMLQTAAGDTVVTTTNLLKEIEPDKPQGFKQTLASMSFTKHAKQMIIQAGMTWTPSKLFGMMAMLCGGGIIAGVAFPVLMNRAVSAAVFGGVLGFLPYMIVKRKRTKRLNVLEEQFPEALDFMARSMKAGHAFTISLQMTGEELADPLGQEFRGLFNEQNLGAPIDLALENFTQRVPLLDCRFFTSSVLLQRQTGGNLSEILTRLAYVIRERFRLKGQVKAHSAHGRMTATVLLVLPLATMLGLMTIAPKYLSGMADDPDGQKLIACAVVAQILGNYFIKKIINIKV